MTAESMPVSDLPPEPGVLQSIWASIAAVFAKEARWRMRGRRAFVVVTVYLTFLGLIVVGVYRVMYDSAAFEARFVTDFGPTVLNRLSLVSGSTAAQIGQAIFTSILVLQTLLTLLVAPALTSGAISLEREKQTLEMLITTPASTLGLVIGKLVSSLAYLFLLTIASIPLMSIVFAFGGIAPEDVVRAYLLLFAVAVGIGSIGMLMSAVFKRTQVATALAYVVVFALTVGTLLVHTFVMVRTERDDNGRFIRQAAPEALLWLNPLVADVDLLCTAIPESFGFTCSYISQVTGQEQFRGDAPIDPRRDAFWPRTAVLLLALGVSLTLLTTQLIAPSRRVRRHRPRSNLATPEPAPE